MTFSAEPILSKIYQIKGYKVMIDRDLADLYGVGTRVLNQLLSVINNVSWLILCFG
ncbi:unnamed protein product [marine sediment metagenome]|uniref:KilA-N DNA-binding domain-containing protein n=1 Tax=marine sediment metagenome TaxID=412755 RepID=X1R7P9_9ZZZZ